MPLTAGSSREVISNNIREMMHAGYKQKQAVAASLSNARRHPRAAGGLIPHFDAGGGMAGFGGPAPSVATQGPVTQNMLQRFQQMTPEQLQEMAIRLGPSAMGQIAQRVLQQKRMVPASQPQAQPQQQPQAQLGSLGQLGVPQGFGAQVQQSQPGMARGGTPQKLAMGGMGMGMSMDSPWWERASEREMSASPPAGFLHSSIPGRTDHIPANPAADSYVIPADVVSGYGEGNSLAGARALELALHTGPHGIPMPSAGPRSRFEGMPPAPRLQEDSKGGRTSGTVPCLLAGGEFVVSPDAVRRIGGGDPKRGHRVLDAFVLHARKKTIDTLKKLPGPAK